jgi:hypothetical protein
LIYLVIELGETKMSDHPKNRFLAEKSGSSLTFSGVGDSSSTGLRSKRIYYICVACVVRISFDDETRKALENHAVNGHSIPKIKTCNTGDLLDED